MRERPSTSACAWVDTSSLRGRRIRSRPPCMRTYVRMRWSNLSLIEEERARLPGYRDDAVVRHFDAPDAVRTTFYEVRAKSILNKVPEASQVPFRWTINPYRGCTHACVYCLAGDTPVLLADGRHKPIADLEVGEEIYGTAYDGRYRRYVRTTVLDRWTTIRRAYRVALADGTELVASGDHRFLTDRGWKFVTRGSGEPARPHLTPNNHLIGTGQFAGQPVETAEYERGYVCGTVRGDGTLGSYTYARTGGGRDVQRFRLARADVEARHRTREYLERLQVNTRLRVFFLATTTHRQMDAIHTDQGAAADRIRSLVEWPVLPTLDWCRGFLVGIFDAEGGRNALALRMTNLDPTLIRWIENCARRLGFDVANEPASTENVRGLRIRGGLVEHLRFFHTTDPSIVRKRTIDRQMVKTFANLRVVSIEPLDLDLPMYDITTGTGDFIADGVVSHNCFARPTHTYLDFDAGKDFERQIVVKVNAPELLRAELARPSWGGEHVALGTNTDPYQWVEGRYKLMPGIWEAMRDAENPCSILTKSPLLLRDLPLMREINERTEFSAALSIPTLDEKAWRATEPHTPNPKARIEAVAELRRTGIRTGVLIAPLMPGVNDAPEQVAEILERVGEAGASYVSGIALHLRGDVRGLFFEWLKEHRPNLVQRYKQLYCRGAYAPPQERRRLSKMVNGPEYEPFEQMRGRTRQRSEPPPERLQTKAQERLF